MKSKVANENGSQRIMYLMVGVVSSPIDLSAAWVMDAARAAAQWGLSAAGKAGRGHDSPARWQSHYEGTALAFPGSQILMWRVSGIMNRQMMKHTAGTTMG